MLETIQVNTLEHCSFHNLLINFHNNRWIKIYRELLQPVPWNFPQDGAAYIESCNSSAEMLPQTSVGKWWCLQHAPSSTPLQELRVEMGFEWVVLMEETCSTLTRQTSSLCSNWIFALFPLSFFSDFLSSCARAIPMAWDVRADSLGRQADSWHGSRVRSLGLGSQKFIASHGSLARGDSLHQVLCYPFFNFFFLMLSA